MALAGAMAAGGLFLAYPEGPRAHRTESPHAFTATPASLASLPASSADAPTLARTALQAPAAARVMPVPGMPDETPSKSAQVAALARSGRPEDAYAAYKLLATCDFAQTFERVDDGEGDVRVHAHLTTLQDACGDLSPGQLGIRVRLLETAVAAHVRGAAADLVSQGPNGEPLATVWENPAYADWKRRTLEAVKAEAALGDPSALLVMNAQYDRGGMLAAEDGALAIQYWVAYADVQLATDPRYADARHARAFEEDTARIVARYGAGLTPEQTAAAMAAGHAFVRGHAGP